MTNAATGSGFPNTPRRDERFTVVERWDQCANFADNDPRKVMEFMHRQMNEEMDATECSARALVEFPDAPWEVRMFLARQCADEARHAHIFAKMFESRGGKLGCTDVPAATLGQPLLQMVAFAAGHLDRMTDFDHVQAIGIESVQGQILERRGRGRCWSCRGRWSW